MIEFQVPFGRQMWTGLLWNRETLDELPGEEYIGIDTETEVLEKGEAVKPVCMQVAYPRAKRVHLVDYKLVPEYMQMVCRIRPDVEMIMHNAPFDLDVINSLICPEKWLWKKFRDGGITDTAIRYLLQGLETGYVKYLFNLEACTKDLLGVDLPKDDNIRLTFKQDMNFEEWGEHTLYACRDPIATAGIRSTMPKVLCTELLQTRAFYVLKKISDNGLLVDEQFRVGLEEKFHALIKTHEAYLAPYGYLVSPEAWDNRYAKKAGGKTIPGSAARIMGVVEFFAKIAGVILPRTEKRDEIVMNEEKITECFATVGKPVPNLLHVYSAYKHAYKMVSTYLNPKLIGKDGKVHPFFNPIMATGRTSCSGPNVQNLPRGDNMRGMYIAPPGTCLGAFDYSQMELCLLAEHCYRVFGRSTMREIINSGVDVHRWFGDILENKIGDKLPKSVDARQLAKSTNFGFPGGLGGRTFVEYCKGSEIYIDVALAEELKAIWMEAFPEMSLHLKPTPDESFTLWNIQKWCRENLAKDEAVDTLSDLEELLTAKGKSRKEVGEITRSLAAYQTTIVSGRAIRNSSFCACSNMNLQAPSADCAKAAMWLLYEAGFKIVNFIHDEFIIELPINTQLQRNVLLIQELMIKGAYEFVKNVTMKAEPSLMYRWDKKAEYLRDSDGRCIVYTPDIVKASDEEKKLDMADLKIAAFSKAAVPVWNKKNKLYGFKKLSDLHPEFLV